MGVLQTLFHQPSRSYSSVESPSKPSAGQQQAEEPKPRAASTTPGVIPAAADERAARRAQYYSAAADPRLRKEWELILANDKRSRRPLSAGAMPRPSPTSLSTSSSTSSKATINKTKDEEDSDQFFTPVSSPRTSPQTAALDLANHQARQSPVRPLGVLASPAKLDLSNSMPNISSRNSTTSSNPNQSYASSVASSDDNYTNYSWAGRGPGSDYTHITIASSSRTSRHSKQRSESGITPAAQLEPPPDWAKDIRWLTPAEDAPRYPKRAHSIASPSTASVSSFGSRPSSRASGRSGSSSGRSKTEPTRPRPKRRMSEIQEEVEDDALATSSQDEDRPIQVSSFGVLVPQRKKSNASQTRAQHKKKALSTHSEASSTTSIQTAELPVLLPHAEPGTYTSLVFPRKSYQPSKRPDRISSSVDMVHLGVGSTTMTTISVTKGAAETLERARRFSLPGKILSSRSSSESSTPKHLTPDETTLVALTSHTPSPTKVQTNQVLVQVCCVALEGLDVFLVRERGKNSDGYGFVPGRGFCGRVIETGLSVSDVKKGDWVMGLLDLVKSGALSEFVLVDRRRIHKCPSPKPSLNAEHLAVLAVSGVAAHRAVSTVPGQIHKARVLVLQAHDGTGALASQELAAAGALVTVQVASEDMLGKLKGLKLEAVKIGTPLEVLQSLENSEEHQFDAVIDTVGGKEIWEACKRVFSSEGQFTTIIGDSLESCLSRNAHVKSNMRSLKSAFRKQENRSLQYEWVSPSAEVDHEGRDIRHSLEAACALATEGQVRPRIEEGMIVPFERAPELLNSIREDGPAGYLLNGGVAVVRLQ